MMRFETLQQHFVTAEFNVLGISSDLGCLFQPAQFLGEKEDNALWYLFNTIPQNSFIYRATENEFFTVYVALINSLTPPGSSPLDPIRSAKNKIALWGDKPPSWNSSSLILNELLEKSAKVKFPFQLSSTNNASFWGLLAGASIEEHFASGDITAAITMDHAMCFTPSPADWFVSSALSMAFSTKAGLPWDPNSKITWDSTFGPNGTLAFILTNLTLVSGLTITYQSTAQMSNDEFQTLQQHCQYGLWPYYVTASDGQTQVSMHEQQISVTISTLKNKPMILAATILPIAQYLGR
jgi:hypothetical protein